MTKKNEKVKKKVKTPVVKGPEKSRKILAGFLFGTAVLTIVYWIVFHATGLLAPDEVALFGELRATQLLGSLFIAVMAVTCGVELLQEKEGTLLWGLITGGSLILWSLYSIHFNIANGVYSNLGVAMGVETAGNLFGLIFGIYILNWLWKNLDKIIIREIAPKLPVKKKKI